jgi:hypothetical protein
MGCAIRGKNDPLTVNQFRAMQESKRQWTKAIEKAKSNHWKEFLDRAQKGNLLWKAARYTKPGSPYSNIPPLRTGQNEIRDENDKATLLLNTFFPPSNPPTPPDKESQPTPIPWHPITESEIPQ